MALGSRKKPAEQNEDKSIEINAQMQGSLSFNDPVNLKINGNFRGSLETKGTLTIGNTGEVEANITGDNIVIAGKAILSIVPAKNIMQYGKTASINIVHAIRVLYPNKRKTPTPNAMTMSGNRKSWATSKDVGFLTSVRSSCGGISIGLPLESMM